MNTALEGKVALVTGAGSGIGAATALLLAERGADVTLVGRRKDKLDEVVARIRAATGREALAVAGDVAVPDDLSTEKWNRVLGVNLSGLFHGMKYEIPAILAAGGGAIVNVSSVFADRGGPTPDYSSAKHAIRGLTRTAAKEYASQGIRVNELQPGVISTEMTAAHPEEAQKVADSGIPMRRVGTGHEVATAIAFLLSDDASYITGAHLAVDGGFLV
jgi:NAD(P)-dependent dehydrogenase (short-subunit alcohol dehydrogenase family)